jgi:hypothetical protein
VKAEPPLVEAPLSLYLDLKPGLKADLEVTARAALAFASAIREVAYVIDPALELRIELESGTDGSLCLNAILRAVRPKDLFTKRNLIAIASAVGLECDSSIVIARSAATWRSRRSDGCTERLAWIAAPQSGGSDDEAKGQCFRGLV